MTPIMVVSFLVSLAWVDFRYSLMRSHNHSATPSRMPRWLHQLLYREAPYQYVRVDPKNSGTSPTAETKERGEWYYHSKQRKLMKMEVDDAFHIRGSVLMIMGLLAILATWIFWRVTTWAWRIIATRPA